jgi:hypothetical protein
MRRLRYLSTIALGALLALGSSSTAVAVQCGQVAAGGKDPAVGELAFNSEASDDLSQSLGGDKEPQEVAFDFKVTGCTLPSNADITVNARGDGARAVKLRPALKGSVLALDGTVDPTEFKAGTHKPTVNISSGSGLVNTQGFKLKLQRREPLLWDPLILLVATMLGGLLYAAVIARGAAIDAYDKKKAEAASQPPPSRPWWKVLLGLNGTDPAPPQPDEKKVKYGGLASWAGVLVGAGGAVYAAYVAGYLKSETWSFHGGTDPLALGFAVAAAAAGGAAVGLTRAITARDLPPSPPAENDDNG